MRFSQFWFITQKETPAEAEVISHQLMLRAGMIRQTATGIYTWMPLGLRVLKHVETVVREEMVRAGALELIMPGVLPAELWRESRRWEEYGPELLRIKDRHQRDYCLGPTHEEVITDLVRRDLSTYKQLPVNFFQIQTKFRDEIRPRFGVMRGREFLMKDAYSFHLNEESLQATYQDMFDAYCRIFERLGLDYRPVLADNGAIGGTGSHEFHVLADTGEDDIVFSSEGDYAANMEKAVAALPTQICPAPKAKMEKIATPGVKTIAALVEKHGLPVERTLKTLFVNGVENTIVALVLRGDHELNTVKAEHLPEVAAPLTFADEKIVKEKIGAGFGSLGTVNLPNDIVVVVDHSAAVVSDFVVGANEDGYHFFNVNWERDASLGRIADLRNIVAGDTAPDGNGMLSIRRGIEVGHIFQLGTKYSEAMNLTVPLEGGGSAVPLMGCYGIGVTRIVAAAIEQNHDEHGIIWPEGLAPFTVVIVPVNAQKSQDVQVQSEQLYQTLLSHGVNVALDDRGKRPGVMFADMDLIGIPHRVVISDKTLADGEVEYKYRRASDTQRIALNKLVDFLIAEIKV